MLPLSVIANSDSLDSVLYGTNSSGSTSRGTYRLYRNNKGQRTFTFTQKDSLKITALLSTYGQAELKVIHDKTNGESSKFMNWKRSNGSDSSPLLVNGSVVSESMFERNPGDYSPKKMTRTLNVKKGDSITISLKGNIGKGRAFLSITGKEIKNSKSTETDRNDHNNDSSYETGNNSSDYASSGGVNLSYSKDWQFEVEGTITNTSHFARLFTGDGSIHSRRIDAFTANGRGFKFRLANKKIYFTSASVGSIHNLGGKSDHWLETTVGSVKKGEKVSIKVQYSYRSKNLKIHWNGKLVADANFKISSMPKDVKSISLNGMSGTVK